MNNNVNAILKLMKSAECKCPAEIKEYAQACVELGVVKLIDGQMAINMKSVTEITDYIIQGNNPEIVYYIKETYCKESGKSILPGFRFKSIWRKLQSEWGKMAPYLKIMMNGMYFPFNEEVLDCTLELLESLSNEGLLYEDDMIREIVGRYKKVPYIKVVKAIRRELGIN